MSKGNHNYIVRYKVNGLTMYATADGEDGSSELHAERFSDRAAAEHQANMLKSSGYRGVTVVKVGLRRS